MDLTSRQRDHTVEVNEMESSWGNIRDDVLAEADAQGSPITFDGYSSDSTSTNSSKEWADDDGDEFHPHQLEWPRRSLANTHILPPHDSGDEDDDDESFLKYDLEGSFIDFSDYVFEADTDLSCSSVSDDAGPSLSATRRPSSSFHLVHDGQSGLQDATFSTYFQILDARIQSGKRGESCCHKQAPVLRTEDENIESDAETRAPNGGNHGDDSGDFVMVDGEEEEEEEEMTDSCLNLISHLDYVMFPTAEVLEFVRGGEREVLEDVDREEAFCRRFLGEEYYDDDNKELGRGELENRARTWFRCGVFSRT